MSQNYLKNILILVVLSISQNIDQENFAKFRRKWPQIMRYFVYYTSKKEIPLIVILALPLIYFPGKQYFAILCDISYITLLKTRYLSY